MQLRPYQENLITDITNTLKNGNTRILAVLPCGGGKSVIQATIAQRTTNNNNRVLFLVHRKELCEQIQSTFDACNVNPDLCEVAMVQTIARRLNSTFTPKLIITDECHHGLAKTYTSIYDYFPDAVKLGFTATPVRLNKRGLGDIYDDMIESVSVTWLIENNFLSPYKYFSIKLVDADKLHTKKGDFDNKEIAELMERKVIYGSTLENWLKLARNKKTIIYCSSITASRELVQEFAIRGIASEHLDGTTPKAERKAIIDKFRKGEITVLSNVDLFGEGFDVPSCECVVLLRPTKSLSLHIQQSMRSMRYVEGKTAIIIDHVANVYRHGLPDTEREWSLKGKRKQEANTVTIKECPNCFAALRLNTSECACGFVFTKKEKEDDETEIINVELEEITKRDIEFYSKYENYKACKTFDELREFQKQKKYKFSWIFFKCDELGIDIPDKYNRNPTVLKIRSKK